LSTTAEQGTGVLLIEQFTHIALKIAHHANVMSRGRLTFSGEPQRLVDEAPATEEAWLKRRID
jgi:branched-chain amino acid transport system ATP-binding protein